MSTSSPKFPSANPPGHSIALILTTLILCVLSIPNILSSIDTIATIDTCVTPLFPELISRNNLGWIRLCIGIFIFSVSFWNMLKKNDVLQVNYLKHSKLRSIPIQIGGMKAQGMFTSWSWNMLGLSFTFSGILTLYIDQQLSKGVDVDTVASLSSQTIVKYALRTSTILFEIAAPASMLVSAVVRYALWPKALQGVNGSSTLKKPIGLIQHNMNIILSLIEVGLLGGLKVRFTDMAVSPLFGVCYVLFAWSMKNKWLESGEPQFFYFFLDTTLGKTTSIALLMLLAVLSFFFCCFVLVEDIIVLLGGGLGVHLLVVVGLASLTCRFRD